MPSTSRFPSWLTAVATTTLTLTIRPSSRTFWVKASVQVGIRSAVQGPAEERARHAVELGTDARDLARGDALAAEGLHQLLDTAGGDALHVGLLHDREQGALTAPPRLEERGKVAAFPHLGNLEVQRAHPRVPRPRPAAGLPLHFSLHHRLHQHPQPFPQEIKVGQPPPCVAAPARPSSPWPSPSPPSSSSLMRVTRWPLSCQALLSLTPLPGTLLDGDRMAYNPLAGAYQGLLGEPTWAYTGRLLASVITSTTWQASVPSNRAVSGVECGSCLGPCGVGDAGPVADRTAKRPGSSDGGIAIVCSLDCYLSKESEFDHGHGRAVRHTGEGREGLSNLGFDRSG